jgi:hypothetical protein
MSNQPTEPGQFDYDEQDVVGDGPTSTWIPPDEPLGAHNHGVTASEQREGDTLDHRMRHTNKEVYEEGIHEPVDPVGRLLQPGDEDVDSRDDESNTVASDQGYDDGDMSAEESAMHTTDLP